MKLIDAYTKLRELNLSVFQTQDVAAYFDININHANKILSRLEESKLVFHINRGIWSFADIDPLILPGFLTDPFPSYISLQTALYFHGMISQIPSTIYAVSLARAKFFTTPIANVSVHHIHPSFFFGFQEEGNGLIKIATPEKALLDIFYLSQTKSQLFKTLPEIEIPQTFKPQVARKMVKKISSIRKETIVERLFVEFLQKQKKIF